MVIPGGPVKRRIGGAGRDNAGETLDVALHRMRTRLWRDGSLTLHGGRIESGPPVIYLPSHTRCWCGYFRLDQQQILGIDLIAGLDRLPSSNRKRRDDARHRNSDGRNVAQSSLKSIRGFTSRLLPNWFIWLTVSISSPSTSSL